MSLTSFAFIKASNDELRLFINPWKYFCTVASSHICILSPHSSAPRFFLDFKKERKILNVKTNSLKIRTPFPPLPSKITIKMKFKIQKLKTFCSELELSPEPSGTLQPTHWQPIDPVGSQVVIFILSAHGRCFDR